MCKHETNTYFLVSVLFVPRIYLKRIYVYHVKHISHKAYITQNIYAKYLMKMFQIRKKKKNQEII